VDGGPGLQHVAEELGRPVVLQAVEVPRGSAAHVLVAYSLRTDRDGTAGRVAFTSWDLDANGK
jgi:hypothetical protein